MIFGMLCYMSSEIYTLYQACQPALAENGVTWDLRNSTGVDVKVILSRSQSMESPSSGKQVEIGTFKGMMPSAVNSVDNIKVEKLNLPKSFFKNKTVYLHVLVHNLNSQNSQPLRWEMRQISKPVMHSDHAVPKRYLLKESSLEHKPQPAKPISSLPRVVEVGFVQELRKLDPVGLERLGWGGQIKGSIVHLPLYVNTLISPRDEYWPLEVANSTVSGSESPALEVRFRNIGLAFQILQLQLSASFDEAEQTMGLNRYDVDSFKQMIGGSSPWKMLMVYGVAVAHLIIEFLAVSSDVKFWREKTSFDGISSSSVALQASTNIIMFLYVQEQRQTKFVMYFIIFRFSLNLWKLSKLTKLQRCHGLPYFQWVNRESTLAGLEELSEIHGAERRCMKWLFLLLTPLLVIFCIYRLIHYRFRNWYSWLVLSLAICAQMGGFVIMTPQVFMNYRLKSVAHLPWRVLTYQAINTFIDDIFVLCIRMPEIQKYSAFRDDIIFGICCIQRWLYRNSSNSKQENEDEPATDKSKED